MLVPRDQLNTQYRRVRAAASASADTSIFPGGGTSSSSGGGGGGGRVLLLVTPECDSLAACHVLTYLLRTDHIPYQVKPVDSYDHLHKAHRSLCLDAADQVRVVLLINCGGTVELDNFFEISEQHAVTYFVIDSHRPYHLSNVDANNTRVVVLDGSLEEEEYPSDFDISSSESDSGQSELGGHRADRDPRASERHERIAQYYHGSYFGTSAATVCYTMACQLQKNDSNMLWLGIVGLTDQFVHRRISRSKYQEEVDIYMNEVFRSHTADASGEPRADSAAADGADENQVAMTLDGHLSFEREEFSFFLFRHWTLFEAMYHARSVATRLRVWRDSGRRHLQMMLAKLGIPLRESNSVYSFMENECKTRLRTQLPQFAGEYGLEEEELVFPSFTRQYGNEMVVSAADMVYIVSSLLENSSASEAEVDWNKNFWDAHDSLQSRDLSLIRKGLRISIALQKEIVQLGHSLLARRHISSTGVFRLCIIENLSHSSMFREPLALSKLAFFLIEAHEETLAISKKRNRSGVSRKRKVMPFVLCSLNEERQTYLVIGIPREASQKDVLRNHFSTGFAESALQTKARVKHDGFESSVIEVQKDDLRQFLDILVTQLQRR